MKTSWISVRDELPTVEKHGTKVLIRRIMNESQTEMAVSIHPTNMVKYCHLTTMWTPIPE